MIEFVYPHTQLVAGVDEVETQAVSWRGRHRCGDP